MPDVPEQESHDDPWNDLKPILDEELAQLPEKYRTVIVLCDLQEKSRSEVAQELSWPEGTVAGRLSRARAMLAKRLTRRGVSINAAILASVLTANRCKAAPEKTLQTTIQSIKSGATTASVSSLVQGVLRSMLYRKIKLSVLILLVTLTFAAGGLLVYSKSKPPVKKVQTSKPDKTKTGPRYVEMTVSKPKFGPHQEKGVPLANTWLVTVRYQNKGSKQVILCPYVDVNIFDSKNNPVQPSAYIG